MRSAGIEPLVSFGAANRHALPRAPVQAAHDGAVRPRVPRLPRALAMDPHDQRLERGEPPQPAHLPLSGAGGALLQHRQEALPRVPDRGGRRDRRPEHGPLDHALPHGRARAAPVGPPQLPRQQPAPRPALRRHEAARAHGAREDLAHRDRRDREVRAARRPHAVPLQREARERRPRPAAAARSRVPDGRSSGCTCTTGARTCTG